MLLLAAGGVGTLSGLLTTWATRLVDAERRKPVTAVQGTKAGWAKLDKQK